MSTYSRPRGLSTRRLVFGAAASVITIAAPLAGCDVGDMPSDAEVMNAHPTTSSTKQVVKTIKTIPDPTPVDIECDTFESKWEVICVDANTGTVYGVFRLDHQANFPCQEDEVLAFAHSEDDPTHNLLKCYNAEDYSVEYVKQADPYRDFTFTP